MHSRVEHWERDGDLLNLLCIVEKTILNANVKTMLSKLSTFSGQNVLIDIDGSHNVRKMDCECDGAAFSVCIN